MHIANVIGPRNRIVEFQLCDKHLRELIKGHSEHHSFQVGVLGSGVQGTCETCTDEHRNTRIFTWNP